jgi:hypothetical protein
VHKDRFANRIITRRSVSVWLLICVPLRLATTYDKPIWKILLLTLAQIASFSSRYLMQGNSGEKFSILAGDLIGNCEKKFHRNMLLIRNVYQERVVLKSANTKTF